MTNRNLESAIESALAGGVLPSAHLLSRVSEAQGPSPATVRRAVAAMGDRIVALGRGRARRYGLARVVPHAGTHWCIAKVDAQGHVDVIGTLHAMAANQWYVAPAREAYTPDLWKGSAEGVFDGLPWYFDTLRPQGFLGRIFGATTARAMPGLPADINLWSDDHVLRAASAFGSDAPGNLVVGDAVLEASFASQRPADDRCPGSLAQWAHTVMAGNPVGSSAGGEQPKFILPATPLPRIVKFSPPLDTPGAVRWADLLVAEHVANQTLASHGFAVSATRAHREGNRMYLESARFDRTQAGGRRGFCHLSAPAAALGASLDDWMESSQLLIRERVLPPEAAARIAFLHAFGSAIGNSDMHHGNLGLLGSPESGWELAPVYDMLPMQYAPTRTMEIGHGFRPAATAVPPEVHSAALEFWEAIAAHPLISQDFAALATRHASALAPPAHRQTKPAARHRPS